MKETQETKIKNGLIVLIVIVLIITIVASSIGLYAWARYASSKAGDATAQVAKWHFELKNGVSETEDDINFSITRTDKNETVEKDKIAPGTFGKFEVIIDSTGTEVAYRYDIEVTVNNCPTNLKFYTDSQHSKPIDDTRTGEKIEGNDGDSVGDIAGDGEENQSEKTKIATFTLSKYVPVQDANNMFSEKIYWDWQYETTGEDGSSDDNDEIDTNDQGKDIKMSITVTGTEVLDNNDHLENGTIKQKTLADLVEEGEIKIADYVNYDPRKDENGETISENTTCTVTEEDTGNSSNQTFSLNNYYSKTKWRVLNINSDGTIDIIPDFVDNNSKLYLYGKTGFAKAKDTLNKICSIYGHGYGAESARSIRVGDIDQFTDYDPKTEDVCQYSDTGYCGGTNKYKYTGQFFTEITDETGEVIGYNEPAEQKTGIGIVHQTSYYYNAHNSIKENNEFSTQDVKYMLFDDIDGYWLASRCVKLDDTFCYYAVRNVVSGNITTRDLYISSTDDEMDRNAKICPVVTLKSDIQLEKTEGSDAWNIK